MKNFLEDFDAEDRYTASLIFGWTLFVLVLVLMIISMIRTIGAWMS